MCCNELDISDVELTFNRVIKIDVQFDLTDFNPAEGDYYEIVEGVATLVKQ